MSRTLYIVENLKPPFRHIQERSFLALPHGRWIRTNGRKLVFILSGNATHQFENATPQPLTAGDIIVVSSLQGQLYGGAKNGVASRVHALILYFDPSHLPLQPRAHEPTFFPGDPENDLTEFVRHHFQRNLHLPNACNSSIHEAMNQLRYESQQRSPGYRLRISLLCESLTILTARLLYHERHSPSLEASGRSGDHLVRHAKEFLLSNLQQEIRLSEVAAHLQISEEHLSRTFKQLTGQSVFTYLRSARLDYAKSLLLNSEQNISQIAIKSGFGSLAHFSRTFKEEAGVSPTSYRNEYGAESLG
jgi:AraC-like DNA-binding protein